MRLHILQAVPGHPDWKANDVVDLDDLGEARDIVGRGEAETTQAERVSETADATPTKQPRSRPATRPKRAPAKRKT